MVSKIFDFFTENKDAFMPLGVLITFVVSSVSLYFSVRNNKAVHFVNSVTKSRIEWIQHFRNSVAEFIANTNIYNNVYYINDYEKTGIHLSKCQQLCTEIRLLLNYCDKKDKEIIELCEKILEGFRNYCDLVHNCEINDDEYFVDTQNMKDSKELVEDNIEKLCKKVQIYLKAEWNRVKYESQGKIYEKETQDFDYRVLEEKYKDSSYKISICKRFFINAKAKMKRNVITLCVTIFIAIGIICVIA